MIVCGTYLECGLLDAAVENLGALLGGKIRRTETERYRGGLRDNRQSATGKGRQGGELNQYRQSGA